MEVEIDTVRRLANLYRKEYPGLKFKVKRPKLSNHLELTGLSNNNGCFTVEIDAGYPPEIACFLLAHAMAHCTSWHMCQPPDEHHGNAFWDAYKKTYSIYERFCDSLSTGS